MGKFRRRIKKIDSSFLFKLTGRTCIFLVVMLFVQIIFYISGNYQHFMDKTQTFILLLSLMDSVALFLFSLAGIIESAVLFFMSKAHRYWIFASVFLLLAVLSPVVYVAVRIILTAASGLD